MPRDSYETRTRLMEAVGRVLAREGFQRIGINAVAREAGLDKVLIYRYFNGIDELIASFCRQEGFWPTPLELMGGDREAFAQKPYAQQVADCAVNFLRALRERPLAREVLAWRFLVQNERTRALDSVRQANWAEVLNIIQAPPSGTGVDVDALQAVLGAAVNHLGTRSPRLTEFAGVDLADEQGWSRIEAMIRILCRTMLGQE